MSANPARQPAGVPIGGQFAAKSNPECDVDLMDDRPLGEVSDVHRGSQTPWGPAQYVEQLAPGMVVVSSDGRGGVKLSPERNGVIPPALRNEDGWYSHDREGYIVALYHPDGLTAVDDSRSEEEIRDAGRAGVIDEFPDQYEQAYNTQLPMGVSHVKDRRTWGYIHADDEVAVSTSSSEYPEMVEVTVTKGGRTGPGVESRVVLVPRDDYRNPAAYHPLGRHAGEFVVDPRRNYRTR